jgi:hypothetical protein
MLLSDLQPTISDGSTTCFRVVFLPSTIAKRPSDYQVKSVWTSVWTPSTHNSFHLSEPILYSVGKVLTTVQIP